MPDDLLPMIWEALGDDRVTTKEAAERLEAAFRYKCPDDLARTLNRYRNEGLVRGRVSFNDGGWVWWADEGCRRRMDGAGGEK